jgi:hypothetical protein
MEKRSDDMETAREKREMINASTGTITRTGFNHLGNLPALVEGESGCFWIGSELGTGAAGTFVLGLSLTGVVVIACYPAERRG